MSKDENKPNEGYGNDDPNRKYDYEGGDDYTRGDKYKRGDGYPREDNGPEGKFGNASYNPHHINTLNFGEAHILTVPDHSFSSLISLLTPLEIHRQRGKMDVLAFQPDVYFDESIRACLRDGRRGKLTETGHDTIIMGYGFQRKIPLYLLSNESISNDVDGMAEFMRSNDMHNMVAVVNDEDSYLIGNELRKRGFSLEDQTSYSP